MQVFVLASAYCPGVQFNGTAQLVEPAALVVPTGQTVQLVAPEVEKVFAGQDWHVFDVLSRYEPAWQVGMGVQLAAPAPLVVPTSQNVQKLEPGPEKVFAGQSAQVFAAVAYEPAPQVT